MSISSLPTRPFIAEKLLSQEYRMISYSTLTTVPMLLFSYWTCLLLLILWITKFFCLDFAQNLVLLITLLLGSNHISLIVSNLSQLMVCPLKIFLSTVVFLKGQSLVPFSIFFIHLLSLIFYASTICTFTSMLMTPNSTSPLHQMITLIWLYSKLKCVWLKLTDG